jgi:hypothetical protein
MKMKQSIGYKSFSNESSDFRGELVKVYHELLGGILTDGEGDGGKDLIFENVPGVSSVQVKNSWDYAVTSLKLSLDKKEYIPVVVGDPGRSTKENVFDSVRENGGFIGIDMGDVEQKLATCLKFRRLCESDDPADVAERKMILPIIRKDLVARGYVVGTN